MLSLPVVLGPMHISHEVWHAMAGLACSPRSDPSRKPKLCTDMYGILWLASSALAQGQSHNFSCSGPSGRQMRHIHRKDVAFCLLQLLDRIDENDQHSIQPFWLRGRRLVLSGVCRRVCRLCHTGALGDERHMLLECPALADLRDEFSVINCRVLRCNG